MDPMDHWTPLSPNAFNVIGYREENSAAGTFDESRTVETFDIPVKKLRKHGTLFVIFENGYAFIVAAAGLRQNKQTVESS